MATSAALAAWARALFCVLLCHQAPALVPALVSESLAATTRPAAASQTCGGFLARMGLRPPGLRYVGCSYRPDLQGRPMQAT